MELQLRDKSEYEMYCEITDILDEYFLPEYKKISWMKSYVCEYDEETLLIRAPGATRGNIKINGNKITEINLYEDTAFNRLKGVGCYDSNRKAELLEKLNQFIGGELK